MKISKQIMDNNMYIILNFTDIEFKNICNSQVIFKIRNNKFYQNIIAHDAFYFLVKSNSDITTLVNELVTLNVVKKSEVPNLEVEDVMLDIKDEFEKVKDSSEYRHFEYIIENNIMREPKVYQYQASYLNVVKKRMLNFSTPGSGKTMMCNMTYTYLKETKQVNKMVIICPKNAFRSWRDEILEDLLIEDICFIDEKLKTIDLEKEIFIINYEKVQNDYNLALLEKIIDKDTYIVFDELHRLKNPTGVRSTKFSNLLTCVTYASMLSGSPIPNGLIDLYYPVNILFKGSDITFNKEEFNIMSDLKFKLYPHYFRVCKHQLQIPVPKKDKIYNYQLNKFELDLIEEISKKKLFFIYKYIIIQKLLVTPDYLMDVEYTFDNHKMPLIYEPDELEYIKTKLSYNKLHTLYNVVGDLITENKPMIIWCYFVKTIETLETYFKAQNYKVEIIYGSTPLKTRETILEAFKNGLIDILITNYATMAESVSLHHSCHDAIFFEYSFNLVHYIQAKDRIHRVGVTTYTQYHYILPYENTNMYSSIDNYILEKLVDKENVMNQFLDTNIFQIESSNNLLNEIEEEVNGINKLNSNNYSIYQKFKLLESKYLVLPTSFLEKKLKISNNEMTQVIKQINFEYAIEDNLLYDGGYDSVYEILKTNRSKHIINLKHIIPEPLNPFFRNLITSYEDIFYINTTHLCVISPYDEIEFSIIKEGINTIDLNNHLDFCENYPDIIKILKG